MIRLVALLALLVGCRYPSGFAPLSAETPADRECREMIARELQPVCMWLPKKKLCRCQISERCPDMNSAFRECVRTVTLTACGELIE